MNIVYTHQKIPTQPPEQEYGNKEYKIFLSPRMKKNKKKKRYPLLNMDNYIQNKSSQMLYRLIEGKGKAIYLLGIQDNGEIRGMNQEEMETTLENMYLMAEQIKAQIRIVRVYEGGRGFVCTVRIYLSPEKFYEKIVDSII